MSHFLTVCLETKLLWCQTPSWKRKAVMFTAVMMITYQLNAEFSKVCQALCHCCSKLAQHSRMDDLFIAWWSVIVGASTFQQTVIGCFTAFSVCVLQIFGNLSNSRNSLFSCKGFGHWLVLLYILMTLIRGRLQSRDLKPFSYAQFQDHLQFIHPTSGREVKAHFCVYNHFSESHACTSEKSWWFICNIL